MINKRDRMTKISKKRIMDNKLLNVKILSNRLKFYEEERVNIESDIELIKFISQKCPISKKRAYKLARTIEKINLYKMTIENYINNIENENDKNILYLRYVKGLTIEQISDRMNYSTTAIYYRLNKYEV